MSPKDKVLNASFSISWLCDLDKPLSFLFCATWVVTGAESHPQASALEDLSTHPAL